MCRWTLIFNFNNTSNVTLNSGLVWSRRLSVQQYAEHYDDFGILFITVIYFVAASSIMSPDVSEVSAFLLASLRLPSIAAVHTTDMYFCFIHYWFITSHLSVVRVFKRRWLWPVWKWTGIFKITSKTFSCRMTTSIHSSLFRLWHVEMVEISPTLACLFAISWISHRHFRQPTW